MVLCMPLSDLGFDIDPAVNVTHMPGDGAAKMFSKIG
jgi:hypothetical protein